MRNSEKIGRMVLGTVRELMHTIQQSRELVIKLQNMDK